MERHKLDVLALVAGLVFVGVAVLGLLDAVVLQVTDLRWLGPLALVIVGVVLVLTAGARHRDATPRSGAGHRDATPSADDAGIDGDDGSGEPTLDAEAAR